MSCRAMSCSDNCVCRRSFKSHSRCAIAGCRIVGSEHTELRLTNGSFSLCFKAGPTSLRTILPRSASGNLRRASFQWKPTCRDRRAACSLMQLLCELDHRQRVLPAIIQKRLSVFSRSA